MDTYRTDDIIYALATGWVRSALAVIRISGKGCIARFAPVFTASQKLLSAQNGTLVYGEVKEIDQVVVSVYRDGHGYTGEEALEISCHGSLVGIQKLLDMCGRLGFRQAGRGEFTYRAFAHGRMDLTQAEAVEELVDSMSDKGQSQALGRLNGSLKMKLAEVRKRFLQAMAAIEVQLDYSEDELDEFIFPRTQLESIVHDVERLDATYQVGRLYGEGAKVVLAGHTNVGKSSLFNLLLHEQRAIVSPVPGTTRDWLEERVVIDSIPIRLYDTAGLRESGDIVESEGISRTRGLLAEADLVVYLHEDGDGHAPEGEHVLSVWAQNDLVPHKGLAISTKTGEGIKELLAAIAARLRKSLPESEGEVVIQSRRQHELLGEIVKDITSALALESQGVPLDIVSSVLQEGLSALGEITGAVTSAEILETIFSGFCVGK